jgi:hypothetical protein
VARDEHVIGLIPGDLTPTSRDILFFSDPSGGPNERPRDARRQPSARKTERVMGFLLDPIPRGRETTPARPAATGNDKSSHGYDGPSDGYDRSKSGYDSPRVPDGQSKDRYDGPGKGYDGPDPAHGGAKPPTPGRR